MKRIFASLFVIVALVSVGVFATSAYFTATTKITGVTFSAGTANIALAACDATGGACNPGTPSNAGGAVYSFGTLGQTIGPVGPGYTHTFCLAIQAVGYPLNITQTIGNFDQAQDLGGAVDLTILNSNSACAAGGTVNSATLDTFNGYGQVLASPLAAGSTAYFLETLSWDSAADQNNQNVLEGTSLTFDATISGVTPH